MTNRGLMSNPYAAYAALRDLLEDMFAYAAALSDNDEPTAEDYYDLYGKVALAGLSAGFDVWAIRAKARAAQAAKHRKPVFVDPGDA